MTWHKGRQGVMTWHKCRQEVAIPRHAGGGGWGTGACGWNGQAWIGSGCRMWNRCSGCTPAVRVPPPKEVAPHLHPTPMLSPVRLPFRPPRVLPDRPHKALSFPVGAVLPHHRSVGCACGVDAGQQGAVEQPDLPPKPQVKGVARWMQVLAPPQKSEGLRRGGPLI